MRNIKQNISDLISFISDTHQSMLFLVNRDRLSVSISYINSLQGVIVITQSGYSGHAHIINIDYCLRNNIKPEHVAESIIESEDRIRAKHQRMSIMSVKRQCQLAYTSSLIQAIKGIKL